jgi:4-amino-4-deoxy-L-arabinose transferase-like glycosyltransferase
VFFGRVPMTDTPMIAASTLAVLGYLCYVDTGSRTWALIAAASAMTAWLLKIPSLLILAPIALIGWQARGWRLIRDVWFLGGLAVAFLVTAIWYLHALELFRWTGWTVGIWHQAGLHPPAIAALTGTPSSWSLWSSWTLLSDWDFYHTLIDRAWQFHLTALGLAGFLFGLVRVWREPRGLVVLGWLAAACAFVLVVGVGNYWHEYYQLPVLPPVALLFGLGAAPLFESVASPTWRDRLTLAARGLIVLVVALASFYYSGVIPHFFRPQNPDLMSIQAGKAMGNHVPPGDGIVIVEYDQGPNSPIVLYFAKRHGWSFDLLTISPKVIEYLKAQGATYFATTIYSELADKRPDMIEYLQKMREVPLGSRVPPEAKLFELR